MVHIEILLGMNIFTTKRLSAVTTADRIMTTGKQRTLNNCRRCNQADRKLLYVPTYKSFDVIYIRKYLRHIL